MAVRKGSNTNSAASRGNIQGIALRRNSSHSSRPSDIGDG